MGHTRQIIIKTSFHNTNPLSVFNKICNFAERILFKRITNKSNEILQDFSSILFMCTAVKRTTKNRLERQLHCHDQHFNTQNKSAWHTRHGRDRRAHVVDSITRQGSSETFDPQGELYRRTVYRGGYGKAQSSQRRKISEI